MVKSVVGKLKKRDPALVAAPLGTLLLSTTVSSSVYIWPSGGFCCMFCHVSGLSLRLFFCRPSWLLVPFLLMCPVFVRQVFHFDDCASNTLVQSVPFLKHVWSLDCCTSDYKETRLAKLVVFTPCCVIMIHSKTIFDKTVVRKRDGNFFWVHPCVYTGPKAEFPVLKSVSNWFGCVEHPRTGNRVCWGVFNMSSG